MSPTVRPTSCGPRTREWTAKSWPPAWLARACSLPAERRSASRATCASVCATPPLRIVCWRRSIKRSPKASADRTRLAEQRACGSLEDLAPGAHLLGFVEVIDDLAHALGRDLEPVALCDLPVALVFAGQMLGHRLEAMARDLDARGEVHHRRLEHQLIGRLRLDQHDVNTRVAFLPVLGEL